MSKTKENFDTSKRETCLVCGKSDSLLRRGLCSSHYQLFTRERAKVLAKGGSALEFEAKLVQQGLLAEDARSASNPFAAIREEVLESAAKSREKLAREKEIAEAKRDVLQAEKTLNRSRTKKHE